VSLVHQTEKEEIAAQTNRYRAEIEDDDLELSPFQESIDTLLNIGVFIWLGAICPWKLIADSSLLTPWRIIGVCVLVLLLRRLPSVWLLHGFIWQMKAHQQALFVGFFGPIGVSAMFYLHKTLEYLETSKMAEQIGKDEVARLGQHMTVVVWVLVIASLVRCHTQTFYTAPDTDVDSLFMVLLSRSLQL
jgi:NhaP-type Na+/H+ or K+/H+ antiporter